MKEVPMIVTLVFILIGTLIQFVSPSDITYYTAFALIVIVPPIVAFTSDTKPAYTGETIEKWHKLRPDETDSVLNEIKMPKAYNVLERNFLEKVFSFFCSIGMLILAILFSLGSALNEEFVTAAIFLDIIAIPRALHYVIYGKSPADLKAEGKTANPISEQLQAVDYLRSYDENPTSIGIDEQKFNFVTELKLSKSDTVTVTDIRLQVAMKKKYKNLLCSMVSISKNKVQSARFPYAYYVIVLKGNQPHTLAQELSSICQNSVFRCEANMNDGNTVYVFTKKIGPLEYATNANDCASLYQIIHSSALTLDRYCKP
ncbi:MAG: hypothetical protein IJU23_05770 [Proteobacteria bacterium]|nr:hypothetical protein [Pseudomonadota bacterium]